MAVFQLDDVGFDRCYKCKRVTEGGWFGRGEKRKFVCLRCICDFLRRLIHVNSKYTLE
jgi:hypothetical protein